LQNPDFCFNGTLFVPIDATYKSDTVTSAGSISLASKSIVSVGIKNADDQYKFIGLRPDEKQDGTEQFEICPELLEINGKAQTINLSKRAAISSITTSYGNNLYVQRARQRLRIMMLADDTCQSFKMTLRLYLTGLNVEYMADLDEYWIFNTDGKFRFRLGKPYLVDPTGMNPLKDELGLPYQNTVKHSLTEVAKGEYLYVKEAGKGFANVKLPKSFLIDADTVYSSTADGYVYFLSQNTWAAAYGGTTGNNAQTGDTVLNAYGSGDGIYKYRVCRVFFYYNLSALSGTATSVTENLYGDTNYLSSVSSQKGTQQNSLVAADLDSFSGSEYGHLTWAINQYNAITYNAQGCSDVTAAFGSTFKTCCREYAHDYLNSSPGANPYNNSMRSSDYASTTYDPYLYVTMTAAGSLPLKNVFSRPFSGVFR
jgi:hypothetical protein